MNVGRSINIAMAQKDMNRTALAKALQTSNQNIHNMIVRNSATSETLKRLAEVFNMKVSQFVALGED